MTYFENTVHVSNTYNRDSRLRAIAMNAVREAVVAFNRVDQPYTDADAATLENIYVQLFAIGEENNVFREQEHQPLSVEGHAPNATQFQIAQVLDGHDVIVREESKQVSTRKNSAAKA
jgi:hypothetical protein